MLIPPSLGAPVTSPPPPSAARAFVRSHPAPAPTDLQAAESREICSRSSLILQLHMPSPLVTRLLRAPLLRPPLLPLPSLRLAQPDARLFSSHAAERPCRAATQPSGPRPSPILRFPTEGLPQPRKEQHVAVSDQSRIRKSSRVDRAPRIRVSERESIQAILPTRLRLAQRRCKAPLPLR